MIIILAILLLMILYVKSGGFPYFELKEFNYYNYYPRYKKLDYRKYPLWMNKVGLYSISKPEAAGLIFDILKTFPNATGAIECFGGFGGDTIQLLQKYEHVISYEPINYEILEHNVNIYIKDLDLTSKWDLRKEEFNGQQIPGTPGKYIYYMDPPWGGGMYKSMEKFSITLPNNMKFHVLVDKVIEKGFDIVCKLPFNYDLAEFAAYKVESQKLGVNEGKIMICTIQKK